VAHELLAYGVNALLLTKVCGRGLLDLEECAKDPFQDRRLDAAKEVVFVDCCEI